VDVVSSVCTIQGGYNAVPLVAESVHVQTASNDGTNITHTTQTFVKLSKNAEWLLKGAGGGTTQKGELKSLDVLAMVRRKFHEFTKLVVRDPDTDAAVADPNTEATHAEIDPMDALDEVKAVQPTRSTKAKPKPNKRKPDTSRSTFVAFKVPTKPPCRDTEREGEADTTTICVYRKARKDKRTNSCLYLRQDGLPWLLKYAADELEHQGVAANCSAVAGLHLEWNFTEKVWQAEFLAGAHAGQTRCMSPNELHKHIWALLLENSLVNCPWSSKPDWIQRKHAVKEFMIVWCKAILSGTSEEYDDMIDMVREGQRLRKRSVEDNITTAVADDAEVTDAADSEGTVADTADEDDDDSDI
jgi:hypothetical protein